METMHTSSAFEMRPVRRYWGWFLALGVLDVVLGLVCLSSAVIATLLTTALLGALAIVGGMALAATAYWAETGWGITLRIALGVLLVLAGWLALTQPVRGALALTALIGWFFLVTGALHIMMALVEHAPGWGWVALNGAINLLLGILLLVSWPVSGLVAIGLFLGVNLLMNGILWIFASVGARSALPPSESSESSESRPSAMA